jgi:hypothetical protein
VFSNYLNLKLSNSIFAIVSPFGGQGARGKNANSPAVEIAFLQKIGATTFPKHSRAFPERYFGKEVVGVVFVISFFLPKVSVEM